MYTFSFQFHVAPKVAAQIIVPECNYTIEIAANHGLPHHLVVEIINTVFFAQ